MGHFPLAALALMNSFSTSNINHDTFKSVRSPVPRWRRKPQEDRTMKSIIRKDEAAVSPVIATILMVAITVVLEVGRAAWGECVQISAGAGSLEIEGNMS